MRHDYDLPAEWQSMTDQERHEWLLEERCRRQALQQETPTASQLRAARERYERRAAARAGRVDVEGHR